VDSRRRSPATLRILLLVIALAGAVLPYAAARAAASPVVRDGQTQPVYSYKDAIRERLYVDTPVDTDHDGRKDRVHIDVIRPKETAKGLKAPAIFEMSPYRSGLLDVRDHGVDLPELPPPGQRKELPERTPSLVGPPTVFPGYYDNYFVPRGYAVVLGESLGTGRSDGCPSAGDPSEVRATTAVIDWLTGRNTAHDEAGHVVRAGWSNGSVGMIGVSYNGTLPVAAAATGVPGLRTIVPIAAISSWYDYYRANGLVVAPGGYQGEDADIMARAVLTRRHPEVCAAAMARLEHDQDRVSGDYSAFWRDRDYTRTGHQVRASVFAVHGINDWNVKTKQFAQWWDELARQGVPRKLWLHQGAHLDPFNLRRAEWLRQLHNWFDHWLFGLSNNVMREPAVDVETGPGAWSTQSAWPMARARDVPLYFSAGKRSGTGGLSLTQGGDQKRTQRILDDARITATTLATDPTSSNQHRVAYLSPPLRHQVRLSGTPRITARLSVDNKPAANLTALLVDYGADKRIDYEAGLRDTKKSECYGEGVPGDSGCAHVFAERTHVTPFAIISRGWLDPNNRLSDAHDDPIVMGRQYRLHWNLQPKEYVLRAGHRIGVVLLSSDHDFTLRPDPGTRLTVTPFDSHITLPLTGCPWSEAPC
jgi:X-Pro dipeptidyl-peptidase